MMPTDPSSPTYWRPSVVRGLLAHVAFLGRFVLGPVVAERRVVVEGDLGVERVDLARRLEDQGVDLDEVGVTLDVRPVELDAGCSTVPSVASGFSLPAVAPSRGRAPR